MNKYREMIPFEVASYADLLGEFPQESIVSFLCCIKGMHFALAKDELRKLCAQYPDHATSPNVERAFRDLDFSIAHF